MIILFALAGAYNTVKVSLYYWTNHFGVFKEIAERTMQWSNTYGEDKVAKVISVINPKYIDYYFDKMHHPMKIDLFKTEEETDLAKLMALVDTSSKPYLIYGWSNIGHPPEAIDIITRKYPLVVEQDSFFNAEITMFKRDLNLVPTKKVISDTTGYESDHWGEETKIRTDGMAHSGKYSEKMDAGKEYGISYSKRLVELASFENGKVIVSAWFNSTDKNLSGKLVMEFTSSGKSFSWDAAPARNVLKSCESQCSIISSIGIVNKSTIASGCILAATTVIKCLVSIGGIVTTSIII